MIALIVLDRWPQLAFGVDEPQQGRQHRPLLDRLGGPLTVLACIHPASGLALGRPRPR